MAIRENNNVGNAQFFKVSGSGLLYMSSKDPKEGYEEHVNEKTGSVSYWKTYWNGIEGYLTKLKIREAEFNGAKVKYLMIGLSDDTGTCFINVPLMTMKGNVNSYVKSLVKYFPNIDLKRKIVINPAKPKQGEDMAPGNFFISYARETPEGRDELIPMYYKNGVNGWPDKVKTKDFAGNDVYNFDAQNAFAYKELEKAINMVEANEVKVTASSQTPPPPSYQPEGTSTTSAVNVHPSGAAVSNQQAYQQPPQYSPFGADMEDLPF